MTKKVSYTLILISLLLVVISSNLAIRTTAHAPETMTLNYDLNTQMLNVSISHPVNDPNSHYVDLIIVKVNGSEVINTPYTNQPDTAGGLYQYNVTANDGATIQAVARCVQGGSISVCIIVGAGACPTGSSGIPGYFGILLIIGISLITSLIIVKNKIKPRTKDTAKNNLNM